MSVRYRITHLENIAGTTIKYHADITDSEYAGSVVEKRAMDRFFSWEYPEIDPRQPLEEPVQKTSLVCNVLFQDGDDISILDDLVDAEEGRFQIEFYINDGHQWTGMILTDLLDYPEGPYPWGVQIEAKDLSVLEGKYFPRAETPERTRSSELLAECFKATGLTLPIRTFTNLTHTNANIDEAQDFLYEIYHQKMAFQNEDTEFGYLDVLRHFCWRYNLIIRQAGGRWHVEQLPAIAKGNDTQYDYDSDGLNPVASTPARAITVDRTDKFVLPGGRNTKLGALKELRTSYLHRTSVDTRALTEITRNLRFEEIPTQQVSVKGLAAGDTLQLKVKVQMGVSSPTLSTTGTAKIRFIGQRTDGVNISLTGAQTWVERTSDILIGVTAAENAAGNVIITGEIDLTATIPSNVSIPIESFQAVFLWGEATDGGTEKEVTSVRYYDMEVSTIRDELDSSGAKSYTYVREGNYSIVEEVPGTVLGEGPADISRGIPAHSSLGSSDLEAGGWKLRGVTEEVGLQEITAREYMSMRRKPIANGRYKLWMLYGPQNLLNYDNRTWFFLGGVLSANQSMWDANLVAFDYLAAEGDEFNDYTPDSNTGPPGPTGPQGPPFFSAVNAIGELLEDIPGETVTSCSVELDVVVRSGYEYWIQNRDEVSQFDRLSGIYPILLKEVGGEITEYGPGKLDGETAAKLQIDEQYINAPAGSLIFKSPDQEEINQVFNEEIITGVVRVQKEGDIGVLNEEIGSNGTPPGSAKTTVALKEIPATIELEDNQTLQIYTDTGLIEGMVVDGNQTLTAGTGTVTIDSKTFSNYYASGGAKVREPGYSVGSRLTNNIYATSNSLVSIAALETHTNIGGGSAYSALTLKSRTDTNESGIATNVSSIATLESDVSILRDDVDANASSVLTLDSRVTTNEGDISANSSAILSAESSISGLEDDVDATASAVLTLDSRVDSNDGAITNIEATAVLKVDANGNIASVSLGANHDGSSINIKGDQVDINNWSFEKANGVLRSTTQVNGNDAINLNGTSGVASFEKVEIRGSGSVITDGTKLENLTVTGTLTMGSSALIKLPGFGGITQNGVSLAATQDILFGPSSSGIAGGVRYNSGTEIYDNSAVRVTATGTGEVIIENQLGNQKVRLLANGNTIIDNPDGDLYLLNIPTFEPSGEGIVWRDGTDLKISLP